MDAVISNWAGTTTLIALLLACTVLSLSYFRMSSPVVLAHNGVWILTLLLVGSDLVYYDEFSISAWTTLGLALLAFNVGVWFGTRKAASPNLPRRRLAPVVSRRAIAMLGVGYMIGFGAYLHAISTRFGLATILLSPESIRRESYLESVPAGLRLLLHLGPVLFAVLAYPPATKFAIPLVVRLPILSLLAVSFTMLLQRTNLFSAVLLTGALWFTSGVKVAPMAEKPTHNRTIPLLLSAAVALAGLMVAFTIVGNALGKDSDRAEQLGRVSSALADTPFTSLFTYLTAGTPAFLALTQSQNEQWPPTDTAGILYGSYNPQTWGAATFEQVVSLVPGSQAWNPISPFVNVGAVTNVYTWIEPFYRDFREIGVTASMLLIGAAAAALSSRRYESARMQWLGAVFLAAIAFAPFGQRLNTPGTVISVILILLIAGHGRAKREQLPDAARSPTSSATVGRPL